MEINKDIDNKKCYSCGKGFRTPADLKKHKQRKTPCLIRDIAPDQIANPNRCIFCNKIFTTKTNLTKHLKSCKIKNGGLEILEDKIRLEQEIRIIKEKDAIREKEMLELKQTMKIRDELMINIMQKIQAGMEQNKGDVIVNNTQINITINSYLNPDISHLLKDEYFKNFFLKKGVSTPIFMVPEIWMNPNVPNNISTYIINSQKETMTCYNGLDWKISNLQKVCTEIRDKSYEITKELITFPLTKNDDHIPGRMLINYNDPEQTIIEVNMIKQKFVENMELCRDVGKKNHLITTKEKLNKIEN
jgi:hypothetical protein